MKKTMLLLMLSASVLTLTAKKTAQKEEMKALRAPSVPLLTSDPYFSVWSPADELNATTTEHWTGKKQSLIGALS